MEKESYKKLRQATKKSAGTVDIIGFYSVEIQEDKGRLEEKIFSPLPSKSGFHFGSPNCRKASNHAGLRASSNRELGSVLSCCSSQFPRLEFCGKMAIMRAAI